MIHHFIKTGVSDSFRNLKIYLESLDLVKQETAHPSLPVKKEPLTPEPVSLILYPKKSTVFNRIYRFNDAVVSPWSSCLLTLNMSINVLLLALWAFW